jgi:thioredoxin reductase (NADPH)
MAADPLSSGPDIDPSSPETRTAQTFPRLSDEMAARVAAYGAEETLADGTLVFARGQRGVDFFLVLSGCIEILDQDATGAPRVFTTHAAHHFTGELTLFNNREILVSGRAAGATRVVRIDRAGFRRLVTGEPDIGEIIMRAFILRRVGLIRSRVGAWSCSVRGIGATRSGSNVSSFATPIRTAFSMPTSIRTRRTSSAPAASTPTTCRW